MERDKRSNVWNTVILSLRDGSTTENDTAERANATRHPVRRVLHEMDGLGWVAWPDENGVVHPGAVAGDLLDGIHATVLRERVFPDGEWGAPGHHDASPTDYVKDSEAEIEVPLHFSHRIIWDAPDDRILHYGDYVELVERGVVEPIPDDEWY